MTASLGSSCSESLTEFLKRRRSWRWTGQLHNGCSTVCRTGGAGGEQAVQSGESSRLREWRKDAVRQYPVRSRASWRTRERDPMRWRSEVGGLGNQRESQLLVLTFSLFHLAAQAATSLIFKWILYLREEPGSVSLKSQVTPSSQAVLASRSASSFWATLRCEGIQIKACTLEACRLLNTDVAYGSDRLGSSATLTAA